MAVIEQITGEGRVSHSGGGTTSRGNAKFQFLGSDTGIGMLNIAIGGTFFRRPWANSIPSDQIRRFTLTSANTLVITYASKGYLEIISPTARRLHQALESQQDRDRLRAAPPSPARVTTSEARTQPETPAAAASAPTTPELGSNSTPDLRVTSRNFVGMPDRFNQLDSTFAKSPEVQATRAIREVLDAPPQPVNSHFGRVVTGIVGDLPKAIQPQIGNAYYTAMVQGWSLALAVMRMRSDAPVAVPNTAGDGVWAKRLAMLVDQYLGETRVEFDWSDYAYYVIHDIRDEQVAGLLGLSDPELRNTREGKIFVARGNDMIVYGVFAGMAALGVTAL